ncbi:hypothetical protein TEA_022250 [Camellia sinensis var. sinensis]|uniref:Uncharacterized protein n=1 Tax=Camellia sinensis var. sinensis TaxID=542762 RepID=A0A4S4E1A5_CAMSN|nr:hypothetical protein TEA_022250 [Camellia sinensis var. sinensis]
MDDIVVYLLPETSSRAELTHEVVQQCKPVSVICTAASFNASCYSLNLVSVVLEEESLWQGRFLVHHSHPSVLYNGISSEEEEVKLQSDHVAGFNCMLNMQFQLKLRFQHAILSECIHFILEIPQDWEIQDCRIVRMGVQLKVDGFQLKLSVEDANSFEVAY